MRFIFAIGLAAMVGLFGIATLPSISHAQLIREHDAKSLRGFHGNAGTRIKRSFQSDAEARNVLRYILTAAGLSGLDDRIILRASADTPNAEAFIDKNKDGQDERLIFYNAVFMQELQKQTKDYWSLVAVLAHELGHHVRFHTAIPGRDHEFELEADYQAGFILRRLGATLDQAQGAFRSIGGEHATTSHPSRAERLQAVTIGWTDGDARHTPPWQSQPGQQPPAPPAAVFKAPAPTAAAPARLSEAAEAWDRTKDTTNIGMLETFIARFKDTYYGDLARVRIEELKKQMLLATPAAQTQTMTCAEQGLEKRFTGAALKSFVGKCEKDKQLASASAPRPPPTETKSQLKPLPPLLDRCNGVETLVGNEKRCLETKDSFKDCPECPEMVVAPAGRFTMGSPSNEPERADDEDQVTVMIGRPFAVGRFAVTRGEFTAFVSSTGHKTDGGCRAHARNILGGWKEEADRNSPGFSQTDRHPVVCVNWHDAKAYVAWLASTTGKAYRLLSEAEREYVTRAGTMTPFWWGSALTPTQANYDGTVAPYKGGGSKGEYRKATVAVDAFAANPWGLYGVHGNVWEWTEDCWNGKNAGNPGDGEARSSGDCGSRVLRGGSWFNGPRDLRSADRVGNLPGVRYFDIGFRVARTLY